MNKVAVIQFLPRPKDPTFNRAFLFEQLTLAAQAGARLVVAPEMIISGYLFYSPPEVAPFAEEAKGESFEFFAHACKKLGLYFVYGYPQLLAGQIFNSQNLIDPQGELLLNYQKRHLFEADRPWASPGIGPFATVQTELGRLGLGICMDLNFPDLVYNQRMHGCDILCLSMHWLEQGLDVHRYWLSRLLGFPGVTLIANAHGTQDQVGFAGCSCGFLGHNLLDSAPAEGDQLLLIDFETS
ncbi:MAG: hypothetical protein A2508_08395 [Candidatus Lambdaproteobacteria bacterium RIFOXYD12_FULL_49_8]|uniref:CN hydrolase domain-containing protein n=1 Tax=Candidatus Lambdaproteobacteria bacterium RIFOXYD2_FULL_50_16 TaxID=1817772 RepID=A0A1F6G603_9PROT|nr:MAG: hypothetical protein A2527_11575 [Candidatus Lambdaproteobacteria bacterium RIFOXYD2_FULL_50_16]OGG98038.1 MAG: hypothetical protein A2508_08395 [Candidatus Lambdaproteobacteria bacterium RIFOXYD12_FULL_49_8]